MTLKMQDNVCVECIYYVPIEELRTGCIRHLCFVEDGLYDEVAQVARYFTDEDYDPEVLGCDRWEK